jgi:hypothetical protein
VRTKPSCPTTGQKKRKAVEQSLSDGEHAEMANASRSSVLVFSILPKRKE